MKIEIISSFIAMDPQLSNGGPGLPGGAVQVSPERENLQRFTPTGVLPAHSAA